MFNGVKVFSATMKNDREFLGERVTDWIRSNPQCTIVDRLVTQSSDEAYHCLAITIFYNEDIIQKREATNGHEGQDHDLQSKPSGKPVEASPRRLVFDRPAKG